MTKNTALVLALSLIGALPSGAIPFCSNCNCTLHCTTRCGTPDGHISTCGAQGGMCIENIDCQGGFLTTAESASRVDLFGGSQSALVAACPQHGQEAALTWRLSEPVAATNLGAPE